MHSHPHTKGRRMGKGQIFLSWEISQSESFGGYKHITASGEPWKPSPQATVLCYKLSLPLTIFSAVLKQIFFKSTSMCYLKCLKLKINKFPLIACIKPPTHSFFITTDIYEAADCWDTNNLADFLFLFYQDSKLRVP